MSKFGVFLQKQLTSTFLHEYMHTFIALHALITCFSKPCTWGVVVTAARVCAFKHVDP